MKAAAVLARLLLCLALVAGGAVASAFAQTYSPELKQKAEQGDTKAQYDLGYAYYFGEGIDENEAEAIKWFHLSAKQGFMPAQHALGRIYTKNSDFHKGYIWHALSGYYIDKAASLLVRANLNHERINDELQALPPDLQKEAKRKFVIVREILTKRNEENYNAGKKYEEGDGVLPNYKEAARLYGPAAKLGHLQAQYRLGLMYLNGKGVAQDYGEAYIWFALLALNADGEIKEEAAKKRQTAEEKLTTEELNQAQAEATKRLEEIKAMAQ